MKRTICLLLALTLLCGLTACAKTAPLPRLFGLTVCTKTAPEESQIVLQPQQTAEAAPEAPPQTDAPEEQTEPEAPAQEETAFPMPTGSMFGLMGRDAVLFDAAVAQKYPREDTTIVIPSLRVYGSFEENGKTVVICDLHYDFYWDYTQENWAWNAGGMTSYARAELETQNGAEVCTGFKILPDGEGTSYWIHDNCGPLAAQNADGNWVLPEAAGEWFPAGENLLGAYLDTLECMTKRPA